MAKKCLDKNYMLDFMEKSRRKMMTREKSMVSHQS
jgi:hypothetical protein